MESSTDLVGLPSELSPGVQHSHHCLQGGNLSGRVYIYRDAPAIIGYSDAAIIVDDDSDPITIAGHRLINAVIYDLMNQVVQSALIGAANIHRRPQPYCLQLLQHLNITSGISLLHLSPCFYYNTNALPRSIDLTFQLERCMMASRR
ncbi:MAG: hypothetical protein DDT28_00257 [Dehalococcoidia bacterium]|nr:hypothetical protein [Chloroflexota bacterium]